MVALLHVVERFLAESVPGQHQTIGFRIVQGNTEHTHKAFEGAFTPLLEAPSLPHFRIGAGLEAVHANASSSSRRAWKL